MPAQGRYTEQPTDRIAARNKLLMDQIKARESRLLTGLPQLFKHFETDGHILHDLQKPLFEAFIAGLLHKEKSYSNPEQGKAYAQGFRVFPSRPNETLAEARGYKFDSTTQAWRCNKAEEADCSKTFGRAETALRHQHDQGKVACLNPDWCVRTRMISVEIPYLCSAAPQREHIHAS